MSLRFKSFVIIISFIAVLSIFFSISYYYVFLNYSEDIEARFAEDSIERISTSLNIEVKDFAYICSSFSNWIKTYNFVSRPDPKYIKDNLKKSDYENFGFSFVAITDLKGKIIYTDSYDYLLRIGLESTVRDIFDNYTINDAARNLKEISGILKIKDEVYIIYFNTVKENKDSSAPNGYFLAGKNIKNANIFKVKYDPDYLIFSLFADDNKIPDFNEIRAEVLLNNMTVRQDEELKGWRSYSLVRDISEKPIILLTLYQQSNIFDISRKAIIFIIYTSVAVIFILIAVFILLFEKLVISKIAKLNENISMFISGNEHDLTLFDTKIFDNKTDDEIDKLSSNIQKMLRTINYRYSIEKHLTGITNDFLKVDNNVSKIVSFINASLGKIASFTGADRAFIAILDEKEKTVSISYEWDADKIEPMIDKLRNFPVENIKWVLDNLQKNDVYYMKSYDEFTDNQYETLKLIKDLNVKSLIAVKICDINEKLIGFIGINTAIEEKFWHDDEIEFLKNSAAIFSKAILIVNNSNQ
jgi:sensor domain CHASE-containing protein